MPDERKRSSSSVERAFEFLDIVAAQPRGVTLSDLARTTGLPVSTCHRYVSTLLNLGVLTRSSDSRLFLGVTLVTLAQVALERNTLRNLARPHLEELATRSGETVHLGLHSPHGVVYVDKIDSEKAVRLVSRIGSVVPHYCTAMGKAILACLPAHQREPIVENSTTILTAHTLTGSALQEELLTVADQRWAIDEQENEEGVRCIGAAISSSMGELLGALSISGPATRFTRELCVSLAPEVVAAADAIGRKTSFSHANE